MRMHLVVARIDSIPFDLPVARALNLVEPRAGDDYRSFLQREQSRKDRALRQFALVFTDFNCSTAAFSSISPAVLGIPATFVFPGVLP